MDFGRFILRGVVGPLFVGHGTQKLFGWFDGHGPDGTGGFFESLGLRPGKRHATAAGWAETAGGALLTLGAFTPLAQTMITSVMTTAIRKVHAQNGPWATDGGYEYNLVTIAAMAAIAECGPGRLSVDHAAFPWMKGTAWALGAVAVGVAGSYLATERFTEPEPAAAPAPPAREHGRFSREEQPAEQPAAALT